MAEYKIPHADFITDRLLRRAFSEQESDWETIRPDLEELLADARNRFKLDFSELDEHFGTITAETPLISVEKMHREVLERIVRSYLITALESQWGTLNDTKKGQLRRLLAAVLDKSPEKVHAVLRVASGHAQDGDEEIYEEVTHWVMNEENDMNARVNPLGDGFDFDVSRLPGKFLDTDFDAVEMEKDEKDRISNGKKYRNVYATAIKKALLKIGKDDAVFTAAVVGLMLIENHFDPEARNFFDVVNRFHRELVSSADPTHREPINGSEVPIPNGDDQRFNLYKRVHEALTDSGVKRIFVQDFASAGRRASEKYKAYKANDWVGFENDVESGFKINAANGGHNGIGGDITLPPLSGPDGGSDEIEPENIRSVATIYVAFQLEQIGLIPAVNRMAEIFMAGLMPLGNDEGARKLDEFYWSSEDYLNDAARNSVFARALGASGGQISQDINPNSEFNTLLLRFVSSVSEYSRSQSISSLFDQRTARRPMATSGEYVRKAGRDLAANVSLYGWAGTHFAAERLSRQLNKAMEILQLPQILNTYGVNTMWQALERFNQREFGRNINTTKHVTLGEETRKMLNIIADTHTVWSLSGTGELFADISENNGPGIRDRADMARRRRRPTSLNAEQTDQISRSAQYWLAVNGIQDAQVDQYSEPVESVMAPSLPALGGGGANPNPAGLDQIRQMASQGITPTPEQILALTGQG